MRNLSLFGRLLVISGLMAGCTSSSGPTGPGNGLVRQPGITDGGGNPGPGTTIVDVSVRDFAFAPATVTITAGTTVRWTNTGPSVHTSSSDNALWDSGSLAPPVTNGTSGQSFLFTFTQPGSYQYHCNVHPPSLFPGFIGTITVSP